MRFCCCAFAKRSTYIKCVQAAEVKKKYGAVLRKKLAIKYGVVAGMPLKNIHVVAGKYFSQRHIAYDTAIYRKLYQI